MNYIGNLCLTQDDFAFKVLSFFRRSQFGAGVHQGYRPIHIRVEPVRFERRLTIMNRRELRVGWRSETPLVSPDILPSFKKALVPSAYLY